jgi:uncharacterized protein (TIRG00374 family)
MTRIFKSRSLKRAAGYILALACLAWVFHDVQWKVFSRDVAAIHWPLAGLAVLLETLSFVGHGYRWHLLLKPLGPIHVRRTTQAVYSGIFMNYIVPMGFGEITRAYLVSGWMSSPFVSILPSIALERLFDAVWLATGIGVTAIAVRLPRDLDRAAHIFGGVVLALVGLVLFLSAKRRRAGEMERPVRLLKGRLGRKMSSLFERLGEGFRSIGFSRDLLAAFLISLAALGMQASAFWLLMKSYGLPFSFWTGAAVFFITLFGAAIPVSPAGIGTYQFFCVVGLTLFGVEKSAAAGFSILAYVLINIPLMAVGILALAKCGTPLSSLKEKIRSRATTNRSD